MKKNIILFLVLVAIVHLNSFSQISIDSAVVSICEIKEANKTFEELKDCKEILSQKDSIITDYKLIVQVKDEKIGDLYNTIDINKDNVKLLLENEQINEAENKSLKKQIRKEKIKLICVIAGAVIVQVVTFKMMYR